MRCRMKKHWFKITLLSLSLILAVVIWGLLDTLWDNMAEYEAKSEIGAVTEYFNRFAAGDYDTAVQTTDFVFDEKNSKEDYVQYLKDTFGSDFSDLRFAGRDGDVAGEKVYRVYSGNTPLGSVRLVPVAGEDRDWKAIAEVEYAETMTVVAPAYVGVSANGQLLPNDGKSGETHEDFADLEQVISVPRKMTYSLDGYLYAPEVAGVTSDGTACSQAFSEDGTVELFVPVADKDKATFEGLMTDFSKLYSRFISEDASFNMLKPKMLKGTEFYESVRTFYNGWYTAHTGYEFRDLATSNILRPDQNTFVGDIKFDYVVFRGTKEYVYPSSYRLSFCYSNGQWLLADLKIK